MSIAPKKSVFITAESKVNLAEAARGRDKKRGENVLFWHRKLQDYMWATNDEIMEQVEMWRAKGCFFAADYNCITKQIEGKDWYLMVVQNRDGPMGMDPLGSGFDDGVYMVDGLIYVFKHKENRDSCAEYLNRPMTSKGAKRAKAEAQLAENQEMTFDFDATYTEDDNYENAKNWAGFRTKRLADLSFKIEKEQWTRNRVQIVYMIWLKAAEALAEWKAKGMTSYETGQYLKIYKSKGAKGKKVLLKEIKLEITWCGQTFQFQSVM
jgi:hypothetical protein